MAAKVGDVILKVDGLEIPVKSLRRSGQTGRKPIKTMQRDQGANDFFLTGEVHEIEFEAPIPESGIEPDFEAIEGGLIQVLSANGTWRNTYEDFFTTEVSEAFQVDDAAMRTIKGNARKPAGA